MIESLVNPLHLARHSALAYEPPEAVRAMVPRARVALIDRNDSQAYVLEFDTHTVVAFRGTQVTRNFSMTDILRNAKVAPVRWRPGLRSAGRVHRGYKEAVDAITVELQKAVVPARRPLIYTGHSLGGTMATLARTLAPHPDATVTFGAPKAGDQEFVRAHAHIPLIRYSHGRDIAPKHARPWLGYRHGGMFVKLTHDGKRIARPWRWYDELIVPLVAGPAAGFFYHRIGEYVAKLRGPEV